MSVTDTVMRPSRSVFRVRQKVVPLPVRVSLLGGIFVTTEKPTSKQSPHDAFTTGWPVACYVDPIFIPCGAPEAHEACYDKTWGRAKSRTRPAPGNHEFHALGAAPYFDYFGAAAGEAKTGYYSYELGAWHILVLNSECKDVGGCEPGSLQEKWVRTDLAAHSASCTLAYWHKPLFSSGSAHGNDLTVKPLFQALYDAGADLVIVGHDHDYERFAPQTPDGTPDPKRGIRDFVVGTGGKNHRPFGEPKPNSELRDATAFGVLKLTLKRGGYDWQFIPEAGKSFTDSGSGNCH